MHLRTIKIVRNILDNEDDYKSVPIMRENLRQII